jgi:hypothetical protein
VNPQTFRTTRSGAVDYFAGGDPAFPKDTGFALKDWVKCEATDSAVLLLGNYAHSMGKVKLTNKKAEVTNVDKTWDELRTTRDSCALFCITLHSNSQASKDSSSSFNHRC